MDGGAIFSGGKWGNAVRVCDWMQINEVMNSREGRYQVKVDFWAILGQYSRLIVLAGADKIAHHPPRNLSFLSKPVLKESIPISSNRYHILIGSFLDASTHLCKRLSALFLLFPSSSSSSSCSSSSSHSSSSSSYRDASLFVLNWWTEWKVWLANEYWLDDSGLDEA